MRTEIRPFPSTQRRLTAPAYTQWAQPLASATLPILEQMRFARQQPPLLHGQLLHGRMKRMTNLQAR